MPQLHRHEEEKFFLNARGQREALPSIQDSPTKQLSVVVPSYSLGELPDPGIEPGVPTLQADSLPSELREKPDQS